MADINSIIRQRKDSTMFIAFYRFYRSIEMGIRFSMAASAYASKPELLRAYVLAEMGRPAIEPTMVPVAFDGELQLAA